MADDLDRFLSKAKPGDLQHKLAHLVDELFPGEAEKQEGWLAEATGVERKTLAPIVPIAQVPEVENSMPVLAPPPPDSDPETETETETETEAATATVAVPVSRGMMVYAAVGAVAGVVVVAAYLALR
jgi:hypothetical protein